LRLKIERFRFSLIKRNICQYGEQAPQKNLSVLFHRSRAPACWQGRETSGNAPIYSTFSSKKVKFKPRLILPFGGE